jgi:hypothetical protein
MVNSVSINPSTGTVEVMPRVVESLNGTEHNEKVTETIDRSLLEGPLSMKPSTRFRQMLARPGIVVSISHVLIPVIIPNHFFFFLGRPRYLRWY